MSLNNGVGITKFRFTIQSNKWCQLKTKGRMKIYFCLIEIKLDYLMLWAHTGYWKFIKMQ